MSPDIHHNHAELMSQEWNKVSSLMLPFWEVPFGKGSSAEVAVRQDLLRRSITKSRKLLCIDEGTVDGLHLAGQGILMDFNEVVDILLKSGADGAYSHKGCGAAGIFARLHGISADQADQKGIEFTQRVSEAAKIPYLGCLEASEMKRPASFHNAAMAYYTALPINPFGVEGLPNGFVVNRGIHTVALHAADEAKLAAQIALGDHGFGERFTRENPFILAVVGDRRNSLLSSDFLASELMPVALNFGGRVRIDKIDIEV